MKRSLALAAFALAVVDLFLGRSGLGAQIIFIAMAVAALIGGSILLFVLAVAVLFLASAIVGLTLGRLLLDRVRGGRGDSTDARPGPWQGSLLALLLGALIVTILTALPGVGGLLNLLVVVFGLGALVLGLRRGRASRAAAPLAAG